MAIGIELQKFCFLDGISALWKRRIIIDLSLPSKVLILKSYTMLFAVSFNYM